MGIKEKVLAREEGERVENVVMFDRYARRATAKEEKVRMGWNAKLIAQGDPECERVIAALEEGWTKDSR